jgi:hypothetical protein
MSLDPIAIADFLKNGPLNQSQGNGEAGSLFESILAGATEHIDEIVPLAASVLGGEEGTLTSALSALAGEGDWEYDREALMEDVENLLVDFLGVDWHDAHELTEMFPPEGADLELDRMGRLVTKAGDILAGRIDSEKLAGLLSETGLTESQVRNWLSNMGVEYQRTGELMQAQGGYDKTYNASVWEENLLANLTNTMPEEVTFPDLGELITATLGVGPLYQVFSNFVGAEALA